jgi:hypothetical protein
MVIKTPERQLEELMPLTEVTTRILAILLGFVVVLLVGLTNTLPGFAEYGNPYAKTNLEYDLSLDRKVTTPVNLDDFDLNITPQTLAKINNRQELLKLSNHLRDIARYLGTGWSVNIALDLVSASGRQSNKYIVTDFKRNDEEWVTISAGYALNLVTQQLEFLDHHQGTAPVADFLVKQEDEVVYHPLLNLPISVYLAHILEDQAAKLARK